MLDPDSLGPPVARALDAPNLQVTAWRAERLRAGAGNPTSAGVYRLAGEARDANDGLRRWSMVMKVFQSPASVGRPGFGDEIDHWNYWLRELRGFESGLLANLPPDVVAPAFYGAIEGDERAWLWIEDVGDLAGDAWTTADCYVAARHLGRMEGWYLANGDLPSMPWLARDVLRQWADMLGIYGGPLAGLAAAEGPFARLVPKIGRRAMGTLAAYLAEPAGLLDALDGLPQTFSHQDANIDNLLLRAGQAGRPSLLALDWQLMGLSPAGAVIGQLLNSLGKAIAPSAWAREEEVLGAYTAGLRDAGAQVADVDVELAYVASTVLRQGIFMFIMLRQDMDATALGDGPSADEVQARFAVDNEQMLVRLAGCAERARRLLES